jgi:hypothetical protein
MTQKALAGEKLILSQYRVIDGESSYFYSRLSIKHTNKDYRLKFSLPYISGYRDQSGLSNAAIKLSYLSQWQSNYIDINFRQKLATADKGLTRPAWDQSLSIQVSRYWYKSALFAELGHNWRKSAEQGYQDTASTFYSLGLLYPLSKSIKLGGLVDNKPTALGNQDQGLTFYSRIKLNTMQKLTLSLAKGLSAASPDYYFGLAWSVKL